MAVFTKLQVLKSLTDYRGIVICSFSRTCIEAILAMCGGAPISRLLFSFSSVQLSVINSPPLLQAANDCDLEPVAYEFFTQAFVLYEEEVTVSSYDFFFREHYV